MSQSGRNITVTETFLTRLLRKLDLEELKTSFFFLSLADRVLASQQRLTTSLLFIYYTLDMCNMNMKMCLLLFTTVFFFRFHFGRGLIIIDAVDSSGVGADVRYGPYFNET